MSARTVELMRVAGGACGLAAGAIAIVSIAARVSAAQDTRQLFSVVNRATTDLNEKQALMLDKIKNRMTTKDKSEVKVVKMQELPTPTTTGPLALDVPLRSLELKGYTVTRGDRGGSLAWRGAQPQQSVSLAWTPDGGGCSGLIYSDGEVFEVAPLGSGLQVMVPLDQSKFHPDHPPEFDKLVEGVAARKLPVVDAAPNADAPTTEITALVAYTQRVQDQVGDIQATINGAVGVANTSYVNSKVNLRLKLVHTVKVGYTESGTHEMDLKKFRVTDDGAMDEIHQFRNMYKADVCVLLIDNPSFCGLAAAILAAPDTAFAVVHYDCAVGNLSFAHEIGHLQGARHNHDADPTNDPTYPWNHGYLIPGTNGRTVMAYATVDNPIRLPNWSNPDVEYRGVPTGTVGKENNARMLNTSADFISKFR